MCRVHAASPTPEDQLGGGNTRSKNVHGESAERVHTDHRRFQGQSQAVRADGGPRAGQTRARFKRDQQDPHAAFEGARAAQEVPHRELGQDTDEQVQVAQQADRRDKDLVRHHRGVRARHQD